MRLSRSELAAKQAHGQLRIAFIGMSNIGKSYTAQRIANADGFTCYDVDTEIQTRTHAHLASPNSPAPNMAEMAKWMGHPYTDGYAEKAAKYLALEAELSLQANTHKGNLILDTTGSVVHISEQAKQALKDDFLIIYIKASPADIDVLIERYFKFPKPTIWGDNFRKIPGKSERESLLACYPNLLDLRAKLYAEMADITINASALAEGGVKDQDILPLILASIN